MAKRKTNTNRRPPPHEFACGCLIFLDQSNHMNIKYCRPDCKMVDMVAEEIKKQFGKVQKIFPADN